jgi:hypothetical protein
MRAVGSRWLPRTHVCREAARGKDEEAEEAGRSAGEKVVPL